MTRKLLFCFPFARFLRSLVLQILKISSGLDMVAVEVESLEGFDRDLSGGKDWLLAGGSMVRERERWLPGLFGFCSGQVGVSFSAIRMLDKARFVNTVCPLFFKEGFLWSLILLTSSLHVLFSLVKCTCLAWVKA